jgi:hypothetical protein
MDMVAVMADSIGEEADVANADAARSAIAGDGRGQLRAVGEPAKAHRLKTCATGNREE